MTLSNVDASEAAGTRVECSANHARHAVTLFGLVDAAFLNKSKEYACATSYGARFGSRFAGDDVVVVSLSLASKLVIGPAGVLVYPRLLPLALPVAARGRNPFAFNSKLKKGIERAMRKGEAPRHWPEMSPSSGEITDLRSDRIVKAMDSHCLDVGGGIQYAVKTEAEAVTRDEALNDDEDDKLRETSGNKDRVTLFRMLTAYGFHPRGEEE